MFPAPHGAVCAALLPAVMQVNLQALQKRAPGSIALSRMDEIARLLTGKNNSRAMDGIQWVKELCATLHIPKLRHYGVTQGDVPPVCEKAAAASSMKGNPIGLTPRN